MRRRDAQHHSEHQSSERCPARGGNVLVADSLAVEHAADYTTYFDGDSRIKRGWAGLYAVTPDHHPIIEESAPGLITAAGFSGHGFQHAPAAGQLVAELCIDGEVSLMDVSALTSDRFDEREDRIERNVA